MNGIIDYRQLPIEKKEQGKEYYLKSTLKLIIHTGHGKQSFKGKRLQEPIARQPYPQNLAEYDVTEKSSMQCRHF